MNVLVIGGGGREHSLAWKLAQSESVQLVYVAPGNAGTEQEPGVRNVPIAATDLDALLAFAQKHTIGLTIVGPEDPLAAGVVDRFEAAGLPIFGPNQQAARLESSKRFCKDFLARHHIPTARYQSFTQLQAALDYLDTQPTPIVIKASGLAAGKGVVVAQSNAEARQAIHDMLSGERLGEAGQEIVIEEYLEGAEASFICMVDGTDVLPLATSRDHKPRDDGNQGPNTGGMGAYSPAPLMGEAQVKQVMAAIIQPTVQGLSDDGIRYRGFLYAGLMIDAQGQARVLEYNCRFGDPETQPILMRLRSDLLTCCLAGTRGQLAEQTLQWDPSPVLGVVLAIRDYPATYPKGVLIEGLPSTEQADLKIFHAGTTRKDGQVVTHGGRVLCVCARGTDLEAARTAAYRLADKISFDGKFCRRDIGAI